MAPRQLHLPPLPDRWSLATGSSRLPAFPARLASGPTPSLAGKWDYRSGWEGGG